MSGGVTGSPRLLLRFEGFATLALALLTYQLLHGSWLLFLALFLVPDLSMLGYTGGPRVGSAIYNSVHTYLGPAIWAALILAGLLPASWPLLVIWLSHIGLDRTLGYGLKYPVAFRDTHLGRLGSGSVIA